MSKVNELADSLAEDVLKMIQITGDDRLMHQVSELLEESSSTLQEEFMKSIRVQMSAKRAREFLAQKLAAHKKALAEAKKSSDQSE